MSEYIGPEIAKTLEGMVRREPHNVRFKARVDSVVDNDLARQIDVDGTLRKDGSGIFDIYIQPIVSIAEITSIFLKSIKIEFDVEAYKTGERKSISISLPPKYPVLGQQSFHFLDPIYHFHPRIQFHGLEKLVALQRLFAGDLNLENLDLTGLTEIYELNLAGLRIPRISGTETINKLQLLWIEGLDSKSLTDITGMIKRNKDTMRMISFTTGSLKLEDLPMMPRLDYFGMYGWTEDRPKITDEMYGILGRLRMLQLELIGNGVDTHDLQFILNSKKAGYFKDLRRLNVCKTDLDWHKPENGDLANRLSMMDVEIVGDDINYTPPVQRRQAWIYEILERLQMRNALREEDKESLAKELISRTAQIENRQLIIADNGYTSRTDFTLGNLFFKVDSKTRLAHESVVYRMELGDFAEFIPGLIDFSSDGKEGVLVLQDANRLPSPLQGELDRRYVLRVMSHFHKNASKNIQDFDQLSYCGIHGQPYWEEVIIPSRNKDGQAYRQFKETSIDPDSVRSRILEYQKLQAAATCIIHGDVKEENFVNGHLIDYSTAAKAFEVDELAYYLSDARYNMGLREFHREIDRYIQIRSAHDPEFSIQCIDNYGRLLHSLAADAFLTQLVLRHAVMNKRDLTNPENLQRRQYYKHRIEQILRH